MKIEDKIEFWVKSLVEDHSDDNIRKFMADAEHCSLTGHGMACPICSHGCFKINVMWVLESIDKDLAEKILRKEMEIMSNGGQTEEN